MDSNALESSDPKAEFRRPSNDAANRKYRKRSPVGGSSPSSDGSPQRGRRSSPVPPRKGVSKVADDIRKKDDGGNLDRDYGSRRHSSRNYHRHDDYVRSDRHVDDYRSRRESWDNNGLSYSRGKEHRSGEFDKYSRGRSDERHRGRDRDGDRYREGRSGKYGKADYTRSPAYEETRGQKSDASSWRDSSGNRLKEAPRRETKEQDDERYLNEEKRKHDNRAAEEHDREPAKRSDDAKTFSSQDQDAVAKKAKLFSSDSKSNTTDEQAPVKDSDIDAAKIAAMKAAELVNKNLVGTGYMSTDQKKKLLWGNKKNTASEESAHRWDTAMFGDRERQEKFNKLMSLRLRWCLWPIVGSEGRCCKHGAKGQSGCGETEGAASDGIGEAIYSWTASARWSNCWTWSLRYYVRYSHAYISLCYLSCNMRNFYCMMMTCLSSVMTSKFVRFVMYCGLCLPMVKLQHLVNVRFPCRTCSLFV